MLLGLSEPKLDRLTEIKINLMGVARSRLDRSVELLYKHLNSIPVG